MRFPDKQGRQRSRRRPQAEEEQMDIVLHASILALGCATFFGIILCSSCPDCGWHEWVSELIGKDGKD
jgi:hypothetical protein